jgi:uncharacterized protein with HEPN domain
MRPEERDPKLLWDILDAAKAIQSFTRGVMWIQYSTSDLLQAAVERKLEIIGEASRGVSTTFREAHPEIPWRMIIAQRNVIAHEYGEIKQEKLWLVATESIPELIAALEPLIPPIEDIEL